MGYFCIQCFPGWISKRVVAVFQQEKIAGRGVERFGVGDKIIIIIVTKRTLHCDRLLAQNQGRLIDRVDPGSQSNLTAGGVDVEQIVRVVGKVLMIYACEHGRQYQTKYYFHHIDTH